jgi:hypothetical protein
MPLRLVKDVQLNLILSRVTVTETRVWIGDCKQLQHFQDYCKYNTQSQVFTGLVRTSRDCLLPRTDLTDS